ncbi:DUF3331 domain-containing protein [Paraburkholderia sp. BCC1884]|uniref:DUF3331 domain-containing protein n=1 Tax=Paraburkholderia sp. BCC1884 TaxID=2562668 RepID=UPI001182066A
MQDVMQIIDPWSRTVDLLTAPPSHRADEHEDTDLQLQSNFKSPCLSENTIVNLLDEPTETSVTVSWHDSTVCNYGEQVWRTGHARGPGVCALSRAQIKRGDPIYQPTGRPRPINAGAMILKSAVVEWRSCYLE